MYSHGHPGAEASLWLLSGCHTHTTGCFHLLPPSLLPKAVSARITPIFQHTGTADIGIPGLSSPELGWFAPFLTPSSPTCVLSRGITEHRGCCPSGTQLSLCQPFGREQPGILNSALFWPFCMESSSVLLKQCLGLYHSAFAHFCLLVRHGTRELHTEEAFRHLQISDTHQEPHIFHINTK